MNFNTNVIVLSLPKRMDLEDQLCMNKEVMNFNSKLGRHLKSFEYAHFVEVNYDRKHYTRHDLHLNIKGKEHVAKQLETIIKVILNKSKKTVIPLNWKKAQLKDEIRCVRTGVAYAVKKI
jgi:xylose isomerase